MTGKQLKNSILQWAIQGKLVPQDPNDEPASVLLEKIRAEKARLIKEGKIKKDKKESIIYRGEDNSYYEKFADGLIVCIDDEVPFEIPSTWEWRRLSSLFQINPKNTVEDNADAAFIPMEKIDATYQSNFSYSVRKWHEIKSGFTHFADGDVAFAKKNQPEKIIYIPHDNRPVSDRQTADTIRQLGYDVEVPPAEILGSRRNNGDPDKLWRWLEDQVGVKKNAERKNNIKAVVISADSMVYGSLVASRKHEIPTNVLQERVNRFADFHKLHPELKTYVFSSIMRTSRNAEASGDMEPSYYKNYGSDIFRYTALTDKADMNGINGLTEREKKEKEFLASFIDLAKSSALPITLPSSMLMDNLS